MADNYPTTPGSGRNVATDAVTYSGDPADVQLTRAVFVTGAEGSKTVIDPPAGAGAVNTGTPRVTLASDDPAVASLAALNGKVTAVNTGAVVLAAGAAVAGAFKTDQTAHGTTDLVAADVTKVAGSAVAQGHGTAATAVRVELPTDGTGRVAIKDIGAGSYETVAASQTDQAMGATGATGDYLAGVLIVPASVSPGAVSIKDGGGSAVTIFTGGASSVSNLVPFFVPLGIFSTTGAWKLTTGAGVSAIGVGGFT